MYLSENYKIWCLLIRLDGLGHGPVFGTPFDLGLNLVSILVNLGHGYINTRETAKGVILGRRQGHMILGSRDAEQCWEKGSRRSQSHLGIRRLAKLLPTLVGRMALLAIVSTRQKDVAATPTRRRIAIKAGRETTIIASSRSRNGYRWGRRRIAWSRREREGSHTSRDLKSSRENGSEARDMVTREKRAPKLRGDGGTKPTEIDANIELCAVMLQCHEIYGGRLIKINLLN